MRVTDERCLDVSVAVDRRAPFLDSSDAPGPVRMPTVRLTDTSWSKRLRYQYRMRAVYPTPPPVIVITTS
jgi:hypothetical protein